MSKEIDAERRNKRMIAKIFRPGLTPEELLASYDEWAETYEESIKYGWYRAPVITLEEVLRRVPLDRRSELYVLDIPAGTGWLGRNLAKEGFKHIDALEPSEGMMKKVKESGVYTNKYTDLIGAGITSVPSDTYDVVVCSAGMAEGHIPVSGLDEFVRVSKKGCLVIIVMRIEFLEKCEAYKDKLEPYMENLEKKGVWTKVERREVPKFNFETDALLYVYRIN